MWQKLRLRQFDGLLMEAAAAWCSTVLMVPLLKENPSPLVNATCGLVKGTGGWREASSGDMVSWKVVP